MSRQVSPSTDRVYGLQRVTRLWGVARATVYRHRRPDRGELRGPGPVGAMSDLSLRSVGTFGPARSRAALDLIGFLTAGGE